MFRGDGPEARHAAMFVVFCLPHVVQFKLVKWGRSYHDVMATTDWLRFEREKNGGKSNYIDYWYRIPHDCENIDGHPDGNLSLAFPVFPDWELIIDHRRVLQLLQFKLIKKRSRNWIQTHLYTF